MIVGGTRMLVGDLHVCLILMTCVGVGMGTGEMRPMPEPDTIRSNCDQPRGDEESGPVISWPRAAAGVVEAQTKMNSANPNC
jgi:hypothetical protein